MNVKGERRRDLVAVLCRLSMNVCCCSSSGELPFKAGNVLSDIIAGWYMLTVYSLSAHT